MPSTMNTTELTGRMMECFRPHHSYYESHVIGEWRMRRALLFRTHLVFAN